MREILEDETFLEKASYIYFFKNVTWLPSLYKNTKALILKHLKPQLEMFSL